MPFEIRWNPEARLVISVAAGLVTEADVIEALKAALSADGVGAAADRLMVFPWGARLDRADAKAMRRIQDLVLAEERALPPEQAFRSAVAAPDPAVYFAVSLYKALWEARGAPGRRIEAFREPEAAARWLGIPLSRLPPEARTPPPDMGGVSRRR